MRWWMLGLSLSLCAPSVALAQDAPVDREAAARAAFEHAASFHDADDLTIRVPAVPDLQTYVAVVGDAIADASRRANAAVDRYQRVLDHGVPHWTLAAFVEQARIYERLARAVRALPEPHAGVRVTALLAERVRPVECFAIARYALAARAARRGRLDTDAARAALDTLRAYDERRIRTCIDAERERDPSIDPLSTGEFGHVSALPRNAARR